MSTIRHGHIIPSLEEMFNCVLVVGLSVKSNPFIATPKYHFRVWWLKTYIIKHIANMIQMIGSRLINQLILVIESQLLRNIWNLNIYISVKNFTEQNKAMTRIKYIILIIQKHTLI